jgi:outer membrane protein assembly factor BamE (lipoprotein component of BamABCDE complex)
MKKLLTFTLLILAALNLASCAEMSPPTPVEVLQNPLGTDALYKGMSKDEVREIWGQPSSVVRLEEATAFSEAREEWVYNARYPAVRVNANYLAKTRHLFFEGDVLIRWE